VLKIVENLWAVELTALPNPLAGGEGVAASSPRTRTEVRYVKASVATNILLLIRAAKINQL